MSKHTPEPWRVRDRAGAAYGKEFEIASGAGNVLRGNQLNPDGISIAQARENARRIIACVNACAGIPSEELPLIAEILEYMGIGEYEMAMTRLRSLTIAKMRGE